MKPNHAQPFAVVRFNAMLQSLPDLPHGALAAPTELSPFADAYALMCTTMDDLEDKKAASDRTSLSSEEWTGA